MNEKQQQPLFDNVNKKLFDIEENISLYHLYHNEKKSKHQLNRTFGDVRFVCMGGTSTRMHRFAIYMQKLLNLSANDLIDLIKDSERYNLYKVGPILFANHGIGCSSLSVLLNEVMKLLFHASCANVTFFRLGTCGGIGIKAGTVVITEEALDGMKRPEYSQHVLGKKSSKTYIR